jgi:hypothetical protein
VKLTITFPDNVARKVCRLPNPDEFVSRVVETALEQDVAVGGRGAFEPEEREEIRPLWDSEEGLEETAGISAAIEGLYGQIRTLVAERMGDPGLQKALRPLRQKLENLQKLEADAIERRFRRQLRFDPVEGRQLREDAARLLRKG